MQFRALLPIALLFLLAACEPAPEAPSERQAVEPPEVPGNLQDFVALAMDDLAARLETDQGSLEVVSAESVTWSDGALGCPEPGGMYTQALRPGYRIRISDGEQVHHYHGARDREPFYCPPERAGKPLPPGNLE